MQIAYHSLSRALKARGWIEVGKERGVSNSLGVTKSNVLNNNGTCSPMRRFLSTTHREVDAMLDLKFVLNTQDVHYHNLKKGCYINQNKGEGSLTCKTGLFDSL
jgi:hypothetical protein